MVSVELHVVITSGANGAVLSSLIHNVIVPPAPLLSVCSCCIIECENSLIFCLQGQREKHRGAGSEKVLGFLCILCLCPRLCDHMTEQTYPRDPEGRPLKHNDILRCVSHHESCRDSLSFSGYEDSETGSHSPPSGRKVKGGRQHCLSSWLQTNQLNSSKNFDYTLKLP